ncbi:bZIP transcription factor 1-A-like isoform X2 [Gigantopelta aegis]|uniref:bZIP transcription factor 1-A-like isoform X2 n=1 Tax=Gigantopelta aegis TaxID=1735272 RepID=UPI001B889C48|nr:bZIP transcription factor 1-A-like isoform X2 [Gigantopelta aegis]
MDMMNINSRKKRSIDCIDHDSTHFVGKRHKNVEDHASSTHGHSENVTDIRNQKHITEKASGEDSKTTEIHCFVFNNTTSDEDFVSSVFSLPSDLFTESDDIDCLYIDLTDQAVGSDSDPFPLTANLPETVKELLTEDFEISSSGSPENQEESSGFTSMQTSVADDQERQALFDEFTLAEVEGRSIDTDNGETSVNLPVKQRLRANLEKKYHNKPLPVVDFNPKPQPELTEEEKAKAEKRKQSNIASARRSRKKSAKQKDDLIKFINDLEEENGKLTKEINKLKTKKDALVQIVRRYIGEDDRQRFLNERLAEALESYLTELENNR